MRREDIKKDIDNTFNEIIAIISGIDYKGFNTIPFEGSWTAGQLTRHVIKSASGFLDIINGPVVNSTRDEDEMIKIIKQDFLDFSYKTKSPDFVVPEIKNYSIKPCLESLEYCKTKLMDALTYLDLSRICISMEIPVYGKLTRLEAIYFVIYHTQRHIHQLKNIIRIISNSRIKYRITG
jgi:hypothetical protein